MRTEELMISQLKNDEQTVLCIYYKSMIGLNHSDEVPT
jgi:hypothetical protein